MNMYHYNHNGGSLSLHSTRETLLLGRCCTTTSRIILFALIILAILSWTHVYQVLITLPSPTTRSTSTTNLNLEELTFLFDSSNHNPNQTFQSGDSSSSMTKSGFHVGDPVQVNWHGKGVFYSAKVIAVSSSSIGITVQYDDDGSIETIHDQEDMILNSDGLDIDLNRTLILHVGKAGGGSMVALFQMWDINTWSYCHPDPCLDKTQKADRIFITVRDPVDRFVSAFHWRSLLTCRSSHTSSSTTTTNTTTNTTNETRINNADLATHDPLHYCNGKDNTERDIIHHKYHSNPNELAAAICGGNDNHTPEEEAKSDLRKIHHAKHTLMDWLPNKSLWMQGNQDNGNHGDHDHGETRSKLLPFVMEPGFDYATMIGRQIRYAIQESYGEEVALKRQQNVEKKIMIQKKTGHKASVAASHSSKAYKYESASMTKFSECCMARHFHADYDLIQDIAHTSCRGDASGDCQKALESIYNRRKVYLEDLSMSDYDYCSRWKQMDSKIQA